MLKSNKERWLLNDEYGSREDLEINFKRIEELESDNQHYYSLIIKFCLLLISIIIANVLIFTKINPSYCNRKS